MAIKVASFFSGCGGLDLGFEQAGFDVIWANEFDEAIKATYELNHPRTKLVLEDINKINPLDIPDCDGFIGGPPCQSWSSAGHQLGLADERGRLFFSYISIIRNKKPKFFLIENVKGLLDKKFENAFVRFLSILGEAGYDVKWKLLNAIDYNVPQNRERVFIIGFRKDLLINYSFPKSTCSKPVTLKQAIGDIVEEPRKYFYEPILTKNPQRINHDVYSGPYGPYFHISNRRKEWHQPSLTIVATPDSAPLHPDSPKVICKGKNNWSFIPERFNEYRRLSARECARIQTFPDNFEFISQSIGRIYRMIGNAVPPMMSLVLAQSIKAALNETIEHETHLQDTFINSSKILIGYYKSNEHISLILSNMLYYVRYDGRIGSLSIGDNQLHICYLLLHHGQEYGIYELASNVPFIADKTFLTSLGFKVNGQKYLCFKLKSINDLCTIDFRNKYYLRFDKYNFAPIISSLKSVIVEK